MGAEQSTTTTTSNGFIHHQQVQHHHATTTTAPKRVQIQTFHSSSEWRKQFNNIKGSTQLVVVDFTAPWCGPCKFLDLALLELAAKFPSVIFVKVDVDDCMEISQEYDVEAMPTLVLIKQGREVDRIIGAMKDELEKKIEKQMTQIQYM